MLYIKKDDKKQPLSKISIDRVNIYMAYMLIDGKLVRVWHSLKSCFGGGYWDNDQPWDNDDGWDNG